MSHSEVFDHIYKNNIWGQGSGNGSIPANTEDYRTFITNFIRTNRIRSVLDVGCGDWQIGRLMDWSNVNYTGVDVSFVVLENTKQYARPGVQFMLADAVADPLPSADLLIMKDVIQHWSNSDILKFLPKLQGFRRALITNGFPSQWAHRINQDIPAGMFRPVDLTLDPFKIRGSYIYWYNGGEPKGVFLWTK